MRLAMVFMSGVTVATNTQICRLGIYAAIFAIQMKYIVCGLFRSERRIGAANINLSQTFRGN